MRYVIDHIEGNIVCCENTDGKIERIKRSVLPEFIHEGDVVLFKDNKFTIDEEETKTRKKAIQRKMDQLFS